MHGPNVVEDSATNRGYGRRWIGHALGKTWRLFREHAVGAVLTLVGTALALYVLAPALLGPDSDELVAEELTLALMAAVGSVIAVFLAFLLWSLLTAPATMEREALALERQHTARARGERDRVQRELDELRERIDRSRLRLEVLNDGKPLRPAESSNAAMAAFIKAEDHALMDALRDGNDGGRRGRGPIGVAWDSLSGDSREEGEFIAEVREYLTGLHQNWPAVLAAAAVDRGIAELLLTARNTGEVAYEGVEVEVTLPAGWNAAWDEGDLWEESHPERPKEWGAKSVNFLASSVAGLRTIAPINHEEPGTIREHVDGVRVRWRPFDLRADRDQMLDRVRLFVPETAAGQTVPLRWTAASVTSGRPVERTVEVHVSADVASPAELLLPRDD